jgi:DNA helicase MCM8
MGIGTAGLAMTLFGGTIKNSNEEDFVPVRGDPHLFIVGDPGLGKSQMLTAVSQLAPRGVYVCGTYASTAGLTVSLAREKGSSEYVIEAGALVLGDQGICCIDEFDKMPQEHNSLLEAMEQQSISIAKAGIVCSLPARTSIVAAANPVGGHYKYGGNSGIVQPSASCTSPLANTTRTHTHTCVHCSRAKTVCENLKVAPAILSRFDLIFILLDKPNEEMDQLLSEHVMDVCWLIEWHWLVSC